MIAAKYFNIAGVLTLGILAQACSADESGGPRGAGHDSSAVSKYDVEHPSWKMHPAALIVQREDIKFVYDVEVQEHKLIVPTSGHEAFLAQIVPAETILVSRANDENVLKNGGFVRRVQAVRKVGDKTELDTVTLRVTDVVRGTMDSTIDKPWGVKPTTGATPLSGNVRLQREFEVGEDGRTYYPIVYDKHLDLDLLKQFDHKSGESDVTFTEPKTQTTVTITKKWLTASVEGKAQVDIDVHVAPLVEFYLSIDADLDWGWSGASLDVDVDVARAAIGVEYEAKGSFNLALAGRLAGEGEIQAFSQKLNLFPGCNIGGVPCGVALETKLKCGAEIGGALEYKTTKPARVYGTPRVGTEYRDGKTSEIKGDLFNMESAEAIAGMDPLVAAQNVFGEDVTRVTMKAWGNANCRYEPRLSFYIGESFGWWSFNAEARAGAYAALAPVVSAGVAGCVQMDFPSATWVNPQWGYGFKAELQPTAGVFLKALLSGHGLDEERSLDLGGPINLFTFQRGTLDPFGTPYCAAPTP